MVYSRVMPIDSEEDGRRQFSDDQFIEAVRKHPGESTGTIAEEVGIGTRGALMRLKQLEEEGEVDSTDVTPRLKVWNPVEQ